MRHRSRRDDPALPRGATAPAWDRNALREAARADRVGPAWNERPMTVRDAARLVDPAYAAAAERATLLSEEAAQVEKSI